MKITRFLNMETDLLHKKAINRKRREMSIAMRADIIKTWKPEPGSIPTDAMPIKLSNVCFAYRTSPWAGLSDVTVEAQQGDVVAIVGSTMQGKATIMRILSGISPPTSGVIFVPSHLRVLHVHHSPVIFDLPIWDNLTFGTHKAKVDRQRVIDILTKVGLGRLVPELHFATHEKTHFSWSETLMIHLARAFIANPEVMVMQSPLGHLSKEGKAVITDLLREFVTHRGVSLSGETIHKRRPRTLIFSAGSIDDVKWLKPNRIWEIAHCRLKEIAGVTDGGEAERGRTSNRSYI